MANKKSATVEFIDSISDIYHKATTPLDGEETKSLGTCIKQDLNHKKDQIKDFISSDGKLNDNIEIPVGTKTLTGKPFYTLYDGKYEEKTLHSDSGKIQVMKSKTDYSTETMCTVCSSPDRAEYNTFDDHQKMIYEMVLLTKKVSNDYGTGSITAEDAIKQYRQELSGYKTIADKNGYEWDNVLLEVSAELQQESIYYRDVKKDMKNLDASNLAHNLIAAYNPSEEAFFRNSAINLDGSRYDETLSLNNKDSLPFKDKVKSLFISGGTTFHSVFHGILSNVSSLWKATTDAVKSWVNIKSDDSEKNTSAQETKKTQETKEAKTEEQSKKAYDEFSDVIDASNTDTDTMSYSNT